MTKWIEQQANSFVSSGTRHPYGDDMKYSFTAGATATLNKVREMIEKTKDTSPYDKHLDASAVMQIREEVRESLREEILKELEQL